MAGQTGSEGDSEDEARARALALLEATHRFPCDYALTVIAHNRDVVTEAVKKAVLEGQEDTGEVGHEMRASQGGRYVSHRLSVPVRDAAEVLVLYARVRAIDGVVTVF